jgi:diaminohydroxyphosphoribosylaminopyrimidine deaminase / 5-amino-6-(5-phosphoribosylamino)uracil reductase
MTDSRSLPADRAWLRRAIDLSAQCDPSPSAFSVGAIIVDADNQILATGYSRETHPTIHAEESALAKLAPGNPLLRHATIYSSMEPCGRRQSRPRTCAQLIIDAGIQRVVYALAEPPIFVTATGAQLLRAANIQVIEITDLAPDVHQINSHLIKYQR